MFLSPSFLERPCRRLVRAGLPASIAFTLLAAGCASRVELLNHEAAKIPEAPMVADSPLTCLPVAPVGSAATLANDAIIHMLAYADRIRRMQAAELSQEIIRLGDVAGPTEQMQLSLVLSQLHQLPELVRAQELLVRVLNNTSAEAQALHPLTSLLAARFGEQRRLEDQLEKQTQQTREVQRRLDQTNERLEALKAIERSLTNRLSPAPAANSRTNRIPAP